jgi:hypothetical protein
MAWGCRARWADPCNNAPCVASLGDPLGQAFHLSKAKRCSDERDHLRWGGFRRLHSASAKCQPIAHNKPALPQKLEASLAVHGLFQHFEPVDLPFSRSGGPKQTECGPHSGEREQRPNAFGQGWLAREVLFPLCDYPVAKMRVNSAQSAGEPNTDDPHAWSAGGLDAYIRLLQHMPSDMGVAIVSVNHLRTVDTLLHKVLPRYTAMPVGLITDGMPVTPDHVFIIPEKYDLESVGKESSHSYGCQETSNR